MFYRKSRESWYAVPTIGPLTRFRKGASFAVVVQVSFGKLVELAPLKTTAAQQIKTN